MKDFLEMDNNEILKQNGGKKFDIVLMNPPYDGTLHLKFIKELLKISNKIVCIHPIDKLTSPKLIYSPYSIQEYKKIEPIFKHCHSVELVDRSLFNLGIQSDCGITIWDKNEDKDWTPDKYVLYSEEEKSVINKIMEKIKSGDNENNLFYFVNHRDNEGDIIQWVPAVHGHVNQNGTKLHDFYEIFSKDYKKAIAVKEPQNRSEAAEIRFKTEEEHKNFIESTFLEAHKIIMSFWKTDTKIRLKFIPWLKDYSKPITNDTIMNFFNLDNKEKKIFMNIKVKY